MDEQPKPCWRDLAWPLAVYLIVLTPFCATFLLFYPDERFYLDASLAMHRTGDLMVPRFDDGAPRLNKPVLTYWIMLASYHLFGVHLFAARLPFLLAGAGVLCLTYWLAALVAKQRRVAQLAVWIMLANPLFWLSCMRCLPDVLLALFALMAIYGYFGLREQRWRHPASAWLLFGGLGLAFGVKGLPALLLLGCIGLHALLWRREQRPAFTRSMMLPLLAGMSIGIAGFAPILWNHANETVAEIWRDQFASRLAGRTWGILYRLPLLLLTLTALHLPWILPCLMERGRALVRIGPGTPWESCLALTGSLWLIATVATENCSVRYLFPLFPWLAVFLADRVARCDAELLNRYSRKLATCAAAAVLVVTALGLTVTGQMRESRWSLPAILAVGIVAAALWFRSRQGESWRRLQTAGALGTIVLLAGFLATAPLLLPDLGAQASRSLASTAARIENVTVLGSPCQSTRVRLALAARTAEVRRAESNATTGQALLVSESQGRRLAEQDYDLYPAARLLERVMWRECVTALGRGELDDFLQTQATAYVWAVKRNQNREE